MTLFKDNFYWILNKPCRVHYDEILSQTEWKPAHRLDFETSGIILFAAEKSYESARKLFSNPSQLLKIYLCSASGPLPWVEDISEANPLYVEGFIASRHRGSKKVSFFDFSTPPNPRFYRTSQPVAHQIWPAAPDVQSSENLHAFKAGHPYWVRLETGARHQIRAFFESKGVPLVGDPLYNKVTEHDRLLLHAYKLEFVCPLQNKKISVVAPI